MGTVNTVLGPIDADEMGVTLVHEHVLFGLPGWDLDPTQPYNRGAIMAKCTEKMKGIKEAGVGTFIDLTPPMTVGRDVRFLMEISRSIGIHIVAATGLYLEPAIPNHFNRFWEVDQFADLFVNEITQGIDGTDVKAGIIKVATSLGAIPRGEEKALRAAARAQRRTGVPISTHTTGGTMGPEQLDIFSQEGADLSRVVIGHADWQITLDYHRSILRRGAYVAFDRVGRNQLADEIRAMMLKALIEEGYGRQMLISHDFELHWLGRPGTNEGDTRYITQTFVPMMKKAGIKDEMIHDLLVGNPKKVLSL